MKKVLFSVITVFLFLFLLDRAVKYYDIFAAKKAAAVSDLPAVMLSAQEIAEYKTATTMSLYPYLMFAMNPGFSSRTMNVNSSGFRGPEIPEKGRDTVRIVVVGGSGAMGYGASSDTRTFTALLEKKLNDSGKTGNKKYQVINAGMPSAIAMQEFIAISMKVIDMKPDIVIVFDGFNDMAGAVLNDRRPGYPWRFSEIEKAVNISVTKAFIRKRLMNYRPTKKILEYLERKKSERAGQAADYSLNLPAVSFYRETLDRISHLLKSYGIKPVLAYQPCIYFKNPKSADEQKIVSLEPEKRAQVLTEMLVKGRDAMQETATANGSVFIDCLPAFDGISEDIFFDPVHFGDRGQEILARFLYEKLKKKGIIPGI